MDAENDLREIRDRLPRNYSAKNYRGEPRNDPPELIAQILEHEARDRTSEYRNGLDKEVTKKKS